MEVAQSRRPLRILTEEEQATLDPKLQRIVDYRKRGPLAAGNRSLSPRSALQWLLRQSPAVLPIPGTANRDHLEANVSVTC